MAGLHRISRDERRQAFTEWRRRRSRNRELSIVILIAGAGLVVLRLLDPLHLGFWMRVLVGAAALAPPAYVIERTVPTDGFSRHQWIAAIALLVVLVMGLSALRVWFNLGG